MLILSDAARNHGSTRRVNQETLLGLFCESIIDILWMPIVRLEDLSVGFARTTSPGLND